MRGTLSAAALLVVAGAHAQWGYGFSKAAAMVIAKAKSQGANPLEPSSRPQSQKLPPARETADEEKVFEVLDSGTMKRVADVTTVTGGFHCLYKGYDLQGQELEFNHKTQIAKAKGNVTIMGKTLQALGAYVEVNFNDNTFVTRDSDVTIQPGYPGTSITGPVYINGGTIKGGEKRILSEYGKVTTCDLDHPHYSLDSRNGDVRTGKRIVLHNTNLRILGKTILGIPYISIPYVRERTERYLPDVGQSQDEGYYLKLNYPIPLKDDNSQLNSRLELMSRLGTGVGGNLKYTGRRADGTMKVFTLLGAQPSTEFSISHTQRMGALTASLDTNYQQQNYLNSPQNTSLSGALRLSMGGSSLAYNRYSNESSGFKNLQETIAFTDSRNIGRSGRTSLDVTYTSNRSEFGSTDPVERKQLDVRFMGTQEFRSFTAELEYLRSIPVGDTTNFFEGGAKTPVITLRSDSRRMLGGNWDAALPMQFDFSLGEYSNPGQTQEKLSRMFFDWNGGLRSKRSQRFSSSLDAQYRQGVYSDDTAQYSVGAMGNASYRFGKNSAWNLRYNYMAQHGFAALDFDRLGDNNYLTTDLSLEPLRSLKISAQTGYDFEQEYRQQTAWQMVGIRTEYRPNKSFSFRGQTLYDTFRKGWSTVRMDLGIQKGDFRLSAATKYDSVRHTWGALDLSIDGLRLGKLTLATALSYNGYLQQFEARHYSLIYDLHCAEAVLQVLDYPSGFRAGRTVSFFIRLKALPFDTPFGTGRRGQSFGIGTGRDGF